MQCNVSLLLDFAPVLIAHKYTHGTKTMTTHNGFNIVVKRSVREGDKYSCPRLLDLDTTEILVCRLL